MGGFFVFQDFDEEELPDWVTTHYEKGLPYFLLNRYTREKFIEDFRYEIKQGVIEISDEDYRKITAFPLTNYEQHGVLPVDFVSPKGITLMDHQAKAVRIMLDNPRFGFFLGTGTGKTFIAITYMMNRPFKRAMVITPKNVIDQYIEECRTYLDGVTVTSDIHEYVNATTPKLLVKNYDQLHNIIKQNKELVDILMMDESHNAKDYMSKTNKQLRELGKKAMYKYLFTGTPQDKSRHDILPQLAILYDRYMPSKTRTHHRYFTIDDYWKPKSELRHMKKELTVMIGGITWGKETKDVIQLTPSRKYKIKCKHPGPAYDKLVKDRVLRKKNKDGSEFRVVADSKGALKSKLKLITSGSIYGDHVWVDEDGEVQSKKTRLIFKNSPKKQRFNELLEGLAHGIIYTQFDTDIPQITDVMKTQNKSYVVVTGKTRKNDNKIRAFKKGEVDFLVMQARSGNAGLDLVRTNNVVYYSMPESYIVYHQCNSRIQRYGQSKVCHFYHLISQNTVDEQIYNALNRKKSFSTRLFKIYN